VRLMVRARTGLSFPLPASYGARIKAVPGVVACTPMNWFGAYYVDPANQFANFGIGQDTVFDVINDVSIPPDQLAAFKRERTAAVAGKMIADKYHWKVGDRITLLGSPMGFNPELTLRGIYSGRLDDMFFFHWDYLNESVGRPDYAGLYWIRVDRPESVPRVAEQIDRMFHDNPVETKTETEGAFLLGFISMLGNVRGMILLIGGAVTFAILLIVANTMAMSIRERIPEAAVMRSLGFRDGHILGLLVGESLLLTLTGGVVGIGAAKILSDILALSKIGPMVWADMRMGTEILVFGLGVALLMGLFAAGWPAYRASRGNIAQALRYVG